MKQILRFCALGSLILLFGCSSEWLAQRIGSRHLKELEVAEAGAEQGRIYIRKGLEQEWLALDQTQAITRQKLALGKPLVLFVHGFGAKVHKGLLPTQPKQITESFGVELVGFGWKSWGEQGPLIWPKANAEAAGKPLREFLNQAAPALREHRQPGQPVVLLFHSMGVRVSRSAVARWEGERFLGCHPEFPKLQGLVDLVVFSAGEAPSQGMQEWTQCFGVPVLATINQQDAVLGSVQYRTQDTILGRDPNLLNQEPPAHLYLLDVSQAVGPDHHYALFAHYQSFAGILRQAYAKGQVQWAPHPKLVVLGPRRARVIQ